MNSSYCLWSAMKMAAPSNSEASVYFIRQDVHAPQDLTFINRAEKKFKLDSSFTLIYVTRHSLILTHSYCLPLPVSLSLSLLHTHTHTNNSINSVFLCYFTPAIRCVDYLPIVCDGEVAARTRRTACDG